MSQKIVTTGTAGSRASLDTNFVISKQISTNSTHQKTT